MERERERERERGAFHGIHEELLIRRRIMVWEKTIFVLFIDH